MPLMTAQMAGVQLYVADGMSFKPWWIDAIQRPARRGSNVWRTLRTPTDPRTSNVMHYLPKSAETVSNLPIDGTAPQQRRRQGE